jgi:hypothetical protein
VRAQTIEESGVRIDECLYRLDADAESGAT